MNVRGERIIVFGDSLSHHGGDSAPEIWDVNQGSNRTSSAPGDLVASLFAEQGAAAVRVNARVSRSAWNFWNREPVNTLLASDRAFAPTKVVVILGTNDVGLNAALDAEAFAKIRDTYKAMGAEVWAVGPFANTSLNDNAVAVVVATMKDVFGSRFIDGRELSALIYPGGDGVHYNAAGARVLALAITDAVMSKFSPATLWASIGLGAVGIAGAIAVAFAWKRYKARGALLGDGELGEADLGKLSRDDIDNMIATGGPDEIDVVQDALLERGDKLTQIARTHGTAGQHTVGYFELALGGTKRLAWNVRQDGPRCTAKFLATSHDLVSGKKAGTAEVNVNYMGDGPSCERQAAADAWAMAKAIKRVERSGAFASDRKKWPLEMSADLHAALEHAPQHDNSEPSELYGVNIVDGKRSNKSRAELTRSGYAQAPCKSGLDAKSLATCWSKLGLGDAKQMLSAFETQLIGTPAGKALLKTLSPEQIEHVRKVVTQAARNAEQREAFEAEEAAELDGLGATRISTKDPKTLTASQLNKELDKLDAESSKLNEQLIATGRGHETYNETHKMTDPLSMEWRAVHDRMSDLRIEKELRYGPGAPRRLPTDKRGWYGPRKKPGDLDGGLGANVGDKFAPRGSKAKFTVTEIVKPARVVGTLKIGETLRVTNGDEAHEITNAQGAWIDGQGRRWKQLAGAAGLGEVTLAQKKIGAAGLGEVTLAQKKIAGAVAKDAERVVKTLDTNLKAARTSMRKLKDSAQNAKELLEQKVNAALNKAEWETNEYDDDVQELRGDIEELFGAPGIDDVEHAAELIDEWDVSDLADKLKNLDEAIARPIVPNEAEDD